MTAGFRLLPGYLTVERQRQLAAEVLQAAGDGPTYRPTTPSGRPMSVEMTNFGDVGWVTDAAGYRYQRRHPHTGRPWPPMPSTVLQVWRDIVGLGVDPDCCLFNLYRDRARMGLHQDRDEADFSFPVLSISLGDTAVFRLGGLTRQSPSASFRLASGDVCVLDGDARLAFHGVDRIVPGSSTVVAGGGRINLTVRRAMPA